MAEVTFLILALSLAVGATYGAESIFEKDFVERLKKFGEGIFSSLD